MNSTHGDLKLSSPLLPLLSVLISYTIAFLLYIPHTRSLRITLYFLGLICFCWVLQVNRINPGIDQCIIHLLFLWNVGANTRYAFAREPPKMQALPRQPPLPFIRNALPFKAFHLLMAEHRHIGFGGKPALKRSKQTNQSAAIEHLFKAVLHCCGLDIVTYLPYRWDPVTFGSGDLVGGDFTLWLTQLSGQFGVPVWSLRIGFALSSAFAVYHGVMGVWHLFAFLGCGLGIYLPEEWPPLQNKPWLSTSLNEMWGKRYHQIWRDLFSLLLDPLHLSRPMLLICTFTVSALLHTILCYPHFHHILPTLYPYLSLFAGSGLGCVLERQFYKLTGRRVGGPFGIIWTWTWLFIISAPYVDFEWSRGWGGGLRGQFEQYPRGSLTLWLAYWLGHGPCPTRITVWRS